MKSNSDQKNLEQDVETVIRSCLKPFVFAKVQSELKSTQPLFGPDGVLESIRFVSFLMALEQSLQSHFGKTIRIADKKAFSARNSPFRTIDTLRDWVLNALKDENKV